ncbi:MAG: hypothetical protein ACRD7E_08825 [Bryobacteraceae bacterium]
MKYFVACLLVCASALPASESRQEQGKRILDEAIAALGGRTFLDMQNRVESGRAYSFYRDRLTGLAQAVIYTSYLGKQAPGDDSLKIRERQSFGKDERSAVLFLPDAAYQLTYRGAVPLPQERFDRYRTSTRRGIFYIILRRLDEPGMIVEWRESDIWSNMPVDVVDIIDSNNNTVSVMFDRRSKLPVRQRYIRRDPKTRDQIEEVTVYAKYRDVGNGVQWPYNVMAERNGEKVFEIFSDQVQINQELAEDLFKIPKGMKILEPKD